MSLSCQSSNCAKLADFDSDFEGETSQNSATSAISEAHFCVKIGGGGGAP
jgi:hypothetical protein